MGLIKGGFGLNLSSFKERSPGSGLVEAARCLQDALAGQLWTGLVLHPRDDLPRPEYL